MKNLFLTIVLGLVSVSLFGSKITYNDVDLNKFKSNFKQESKNLDMSFYQDLIIGDRPIKTIPVIKKDKVIGRYLEIGSEQKIYIDLSEFKSAVVLYNVEDPSQYIKIRTVFNAKNGKYELQESLTEYGGFWCKAACTVASLAIAASDGPSPLLDVLALAHQVACIADCES